IANNLIGTILIASSTNTLLSSIWISLLIGMAFPAVGTIVASSGVLWLRSRTTAAPRRDLAIPEKNSLVRNCKNEIAASSRRFFTQTIPYASAYSGFVASSLFVSFLPDGLGQTIASWLHAAVRDANMPEGVVYSNLSLTVCTITATTLIFAFNSLAVRFSSGFQTFFRNGMTSLAGDGIMENLIRTLNVPVNKIRLPSRQPYLRSAWESLI